MHPKQNQNPLLPDVHEATGVEQRMKAQGERIHIPLGAICNNHCLFCMEDHRQARARVNGSMSLDRLTRILHMHTNVEELCFTSGEPTLHPRLPDFIQLARQSGCKKVSLMTNGRRLSYRPYVRMLANAGLNRVYISIHGNTPTLHDGLTRCPGSFEQTLAGIRVVAACHQLELLTSTVITKRNLSSLLEIYELLVKQEVTQTVFNALQVNGGALTHFQRLVPRYALIRKEFERLLGHAKDGGKTAYLVDVPWCITEGLPDEHRGFLERRVHYEAEVPGIQPACATSRLGLDGIRKVASENLNAAFRRFGPKCQACRHRSSCPGVYERYATEFGWDELQPVID